MDTRISIAMATYNGASYLEQQLNSLLEQKMHPYELVVCDDCSTDDTPNLLECFKERCHFPVRVYKNPERLRHERNFIKAAMLCEGDWIAFSDQDDYWMPEKLERVAEIIEKNPQLVSVVHTAQRVDENLGFSSKQLWPRINKFWLSDPLTAPCMSYIRNSGHALVINTGVFKSVHKLLCGDDGSPICKAVAHDIWANLIASTFGVVAYTPDMLVLHRRHAMAHTQSGMERGFMSRIKTSCKAGRNLYKEQSKIAKGYSDLLRENRDLFNQEMRAQASSASDYYEEVSKMLDWRTVILGATFPQRVHAFLMLLLKRAYFSHPIGVGMGLNAFLKDAYFTFSPYSGKQEKIDADRA